MSPPALPSLDGLYSDFVNPQWVKLLNILQMNVPSPSSAQKLQHRKEDIDRIQIDGQRE